VETEISKWIYSTILFAESEQGVDGFRFRSLLTGTGTTVKSEMLALFKCEPQWKLYEEELIEISDIQGSPSSTESDPVPIRGYRAEVRGWMKQTGFTSVGDAARYLGVSESTLKSIMTSKGDIRHSRPTLDSVLMKVRSVRTGE
jgi:hypothetical protein